MNMACVEREFVNVEVMRMLPFWGFEVLRGGEEADINEGNIYLVQLIGLRRKNKINGREYDKEWCAAEDQRKYGRKKRNWYNL